MWNIWLLLVLGLLHLRLFATSEVTVQILLDDNNILNRNNDSSSGDVETSSREDATTESQISTTDIQNIGLSILWFFFCFSLKQQNFLWDTHFQLCRYITLLKKHS